MLRRSSRLIACNFACMRSRRDFRLIWNLPRRVLLQIKVKPRKVKVSGLPSPRRLRFSTAKRPTAVGKHLTEMAARHMKPVLMELGGHAPVIVCDDVDPLAAGVMSAVRKARNAGQVCTSPTRFYVHDSVYKAFTEFLVKKGRAVKLGNGLDATTKMGPVANHRRVEALEQIVADAEANGTRILTGGKRLGTRGYYFPLTVLADVPDDAQATHVEPFGPLALI